MWGCYSAQLPSFSGFFEISLTKKGLLSTASTLPASPTREVGTPKWVTLLHRLFMSGSQFQINHNVKLHGCGMQAFAGNLAIWEARNKPSPRS